MAPRAIATAAGVPPLAPWLVAPASQHLRSTSNHTQRLGDAVFALAADDQIRQISAYMKLVAWIAGALAHWDGSAPAPNPDATPVILVHGIYSSAGDMARLANQLRKTGRPVFTPTLDPANGEATLESLAAQLAAFADREVPDGKFDLVGFSMGGLVSRYYVQRLGGIDRVGRFVTLATPHNGTIMARLFRGAGHLQMRPGSQFLRDLDSDADTLKRVGFTSLYTPLDTIIVPAKSSEQFAATNVKVWGVMHPSFVLEKRCIKAVAECLK